MAIANNKVCRALKKIENLLIVRLIEIIFIWVIIHIETSQLHYRTSY